MRGARPAMRDDNDDDDDDDNDFVIITKTCIPHPNKYTQLTLNINSELDFRDYFDMLLEDDVGCLNRPAYNNDDDDRLHERATTC